MAAEILKEFFKSMNLYEIFLFLACLLFLAYKLRKYIKQSYEEHYQKQRRTIETQENIINMYNTQSALLEKKKNHAEQRILVQESEIDRLKQETIEYLLQGKHLELNVHDLSNAVKELIGLLFRSIQLQKAFVIHSTIKTMLFAYQGMGIGKRPNCPNPMEFYNELEQVEINLRETVDNFDSLFPVKSKGLIPEIQVPDSIAKFNALSIMDRLFKIDERMRAVAAPYLKAEKADSKNT